MQLLRMTLRIFLCSAIIFSCAASTGQDYPHKAIRIVTSGLGGANDFAARLIAPALTSSLGQPVIVENRGGGVIPGQTVAKSPADGYTLLLYGAPIWIGPLLQKTPYEVKDFAPISLTNRSPNLLVVHPSLPVKSLKDLLALARSKPGALNYSSGGTGSSSHLAAELLKAMARVNIVRIAYKDSSTEIAAMISGQVQLSFPSPAVSPYLKSGKLKALAVTSAQPSVLAPGLPTMSESGVPGYESVGLSAIFAPAGTAPAIINRLSQEVLRVLSRPDVKDRFLSTGIEAAGGSPEELSATIRSEVSKWSKVIKDAGIKEE